MRPGVGITSSQTIDRLWLNGFNRTQSTMQLIQQIRVPSTQKARYRRLDEQSKELLSIGSGTDDFTYKFVMNGMVSLINSAKSLRNGEVAETFGVAPPALSRNPAFGENISRCVRKTRCKKRKLLSCRVCTNSGRSDGIGHRAYSSKCPMFRPMNATVQTSSETRECEIGDQP